MPSPYAYLEKFLMPIYYKSVAAIILLSASSVFAGAIENINAANGNYQPDYQYSMKAPVPIETKKPVPSYSKSIFGNQELPRSPRGDKTHLTKTLAELPTIPPITKNGGLSSNCQIRFLVGLNNVPQKGRISGFLLGGNSSSSMTFSPIIMSQNLRFGIPLSFGMEKNCWRMFVPQSFSIGKALRKKLNAGYNKRLLYIMRHK